MLVWWRYRCDEGHAWTMLRDTDADEAPGDATCDFGHPAVTLQKHEPADQTIVGLVPAAYLADSVTGQLAHERQFHLEISNWSGTARQLSVERFEWSDAVRAAELSRGLGYEEARQRWDRSALGNWLDGARH